MNIDRSIAIRGFCGSLFGQMFVTLPVTGAAIGRNFHVAVVIGIIESLFQGNADAKALCFVTERHAAQHVQQVTD